MLVLRLAVPERQPRGTVRRFPQPPGPAVEQREQPQPVRLALLPLPEEQLALQAELPQEEPEVLAQRPRPVSEPVAVWQRAASPAPGLPLPAEALPERRPGALPRLLHQTAELPLRLAASGRPFLPEP